MVDFCDKWKTTNQHARGIIGEEMNKISKITTRSTLASAYIEEQKTRGKDEIPENLTEKMYGAITSFKEKYTMIHHNQNQLSQLLMSVKNLKATKINALKRYATLPGIQLELFWLIVYTYLPEK